MQRRIDALCGAGASTSCRSRRACSARSRSRPGCPSWSTSTTSSTRSSRGCTRASGPGRGGRSTASSTPASGASSSAGGAAPRGAPSRPSARRGSCARSRRARRSRSSRTADLDVFRPSRTPPEPRSVVFNGILDYRPNLDAANHLVDEIWPRVQRHSPGARLTIVGRGHPGDIQRLRRPGVAVTGEVPDVRPYLERAAVVAVPVRMGGGTRLKVLEGLAVGKPMVSTTLGCEGVTVRDGEHLLMADGADAFAAAIGRLFEHPGLGHALGRPAAASSSASTRGTSPRTAWTTSSPVSALARGARRPRSSWPAPRRRGSRREPAQRPAGGAECAGRRRRRASASCARPTCTSRPCSARPRRSSTPASRGRGAEHAPPERPARTVVNGVRATTSLPAGSAARAATGHLFDYAWFFTLAAGTLAARHVRRPYTAVQVNTMPDFPSSSPPPSRSCSGARSSSR